MGNSNHPDPFLVDLASDVVVTAETREKKPAGEGIPRFGPEALSLSAPETIIWNGNA